MSKGTAPQYIGAWGDNVVLSDGRKVEVMHRGSIEVPLDSVTGNLQAHNAAATLAHITASIEELATRATGHRTAAIAHDNGRALRVSVWLNGRGNERLARVAALVNRAVHPGGRVGTQRATDIEGRLERLTSLLPSLTGMADAHRSYQEQLRDQREIRVLAALKDPILRAVLDTLHVDAPESGGDEYERYVLVVGSALMAAEDTLADRDSVSSEQMAATLRQALPSEVRTLSCEAPALAWAGFAFANG